MSFRRFFGTTSLLLVGAVIMFSLFSERRLLLFFEPPKGSVMSNSAANIVTGDSTNNTNANSAGCSFLGKVFCIGMFKTGTTTCGKLMLLLGYPHVGKTKGYWPLWPESMWDDTVAKDFYTMDRIRNESSEIYNNLLETSSANDGPWLFMFEELYRQFPNDGSRYIYSERDARELISSDFNHFWGPMNRTHDDLVQNKERLYMLDVVSTQMAILRRYWMHQQRVLSFFSGSRQRYLQRVDFSRADSREAIESFLGCPLSGYSIPHENPGTKTRSSYYRITDELWKFLISYKDFDFSGITKGKEPVHFKSNKTAHAMWLEIMMTQNATGYFA